MNTKPILAYDCACVGASIALRVGGHTHAHSLAQSAQAAELIPAIDALLREHSVAYAELGSIVTTIGPGSFTGVRIGLAALHGLVLVNRTPIKLISTLEAAAWQVASSHKPPQFIVSLRAGKGEVYAQSFQLNDGKPVASGDITLEPETRNDWSLPHFSLAPDAAAMCEIAELLPSASLTDALPLYIRPPDAAVPAPYAWLAAN
jgi:tRNA threonylcarbamoyl adenosine modification protein YeaZ